MEIGERFGTGRLLRILRDGEPEWGSLEGDEIRTESGERIPESEEHYLAPVEPTKIQRMRPNAWCGTEGRVEVTYRRLSETPSYGGIPIGKSEDRKDD